MSESCFFPILYWISGISRISRIQLESLNQSVMTESLLCLPLTVGSVGVMVMTPDWESVGCQFKYRNFLFLIEMPSPISLILNAK